MSSLFALFLAATIAQAGNPSDCDVPAKVADIEAATLQTTLAFATVDVDGFGAHYRSTLRALDCVTERLPSTTIVSLHRTEALGAFFERDTERTRNAFQALLAVNPGWTLPSTLAAEGGEVDQVLQAAKERPPSLLVPVAVPETLTLLIDGEPAAQRPANIPAVVQITGEDGAVVWNGYVQAGEALPDLEALARQDAKRVAEAKALLWTNRVGVEVGPVFGLRLERQHSQGLLAGYGLRTGGMVVLLNNGQSATALHLLGDVDVRLSDRVDVELALGFGSAKGRGGAAVGAGLQAHWDHVQAQVGLVIVGGDGGGGVCPDLSVAWMF